MYRVEKDSLGEMQIPENALYGIHALRARENFPGNIPFPVEWFMAAGLIKQACYKTYRKFRDAAVKKYGGEVQIKIIEDKYLDSLIKAAGEVAAGRYYDSFIVPAVQGGAGTSINMNINEIITNVALLTTGNKCGDYSLLDPVEDANIYQSTNDVVPSALTVAVMKQLGELEEKINLLRLKTEEIEKTGRNKLRPGYTQMQEAVPSSFGILFGSYNDALSRDWWRVSKCSERIKVINLGGGAIGTGLAVPKYFIMEVVPVLREMTGLPLTQGENLADATSNLDKWVEIHATLKAHAVNLEKIASDLRLLASDLSGTKYISIPARQVGSSIMPGKVNPVIAEFVISASHKVYSNDMLISSLSSQGCLELNAYLPVIGHAVIESLNLLISADHSLLKNLMEGITINESISYKALIYSPSLTTALTPHIGYHRAAEIASLMKEKGIDIFSANNELKIVDGDVLADLLKPENLLKLGFSLDEIITK